MKYRSASTIESISFACLGLVLTVACGGSSTVTGGNGGGAGTASGGTGNAGSAGSAGTGGAATGGAAGSAGSGGASACNPACGTSRQCCAGKCVNEENDPHNCGACGKTCDAGTYCGSGQCVKPPCETTCTGDTCCGTECCMAGQICCDPQGPLDSGPRCTTPSDSGTCPMGCAPLCVCAAPDTPIATPSGERPIASLKVGDLVYSVDGSAVKAVPIVRINHTAVSHHHVMRVTLATGERLEISAAHPTADGHSFGDLRTGSSLDGVSVVSVESEPYPFSATYDILPGSSTGTYFAGGALIGSTLFGAGPGALPSTCRGAP